MFVVIVTDASMSYLYGPFRTFKAAQDWADSMAEIFAGRIVHVVRNQPIDPAE